MSKAPPSTFATLLRKSKFASYDPHISQVYTTSKSHGHRGDWGIKRPIVAKRGHISIQNVDTIYQQTEWTKASTTAQFMKTFPEMSRPLVRTPGSWTKSLNTLNVGADWDVDSDFVRKAEPVVVASPDVTTSESTGLSEAQGKAGSSGRAKSKRRDVFRPASIRNPSAMRAKPFESYIRKLQNESPSFSNYLEEKRLASGKDARPEVDYDVSDQHKRYISRKNEEEISKLTSTEIRPNPHPYAGLTYGHPSELELFYSSSTLPGRIVESAYSDLLVDVGGFIGTVTHNKSDGLGVTDLGTQDGVRKDRESGHGVFRSEKVALADAPKVVGSKPEGLSDAELNISFRGCKTLMQSRQNPHRPGSREYIAWLDHDFARSENSMSKKFVPPRRNATPEAGGKLILDTLGALR